MSFILDTCFICTLIILIFPFFICIEDILNGFKLPDGINSKQFNVRHFIPSSSELLCYIYHTSVLFIHTCRLSSREFITKWKTNKDVYLVFTHPKHLQPLITAHLNVNWLNYSQHPLDTLSPHPVVSRHYGKWKVRCDPDLFAQLPGVTHSHSKARHPVPRGIYSRQSELDKDQNWAPPSMGVPGPVQDLLTPNTRRRVCHRCLHPAGSRPALRHHKGENLLQREPWNYRRWKPGKPWDGNGREEGYRGQTCTSAHKIQVIAHHLEREHTAHLRTYSLHKVFTSIFFSLFFFSSKLSTELHPLKHQVTFGVSTELTKCQHLCSPCQLQVSSNHVPTCSFLLKRLLTKAEATGLWVPLSWASI